MRKEERLKDAMNGLEPTCRQKDHIWLGIEEKMKAVNNQSTSNEASEEIRICHSLAENKKKMRKSIITIVSVAAGLAIVISAGVVLQKNQSDTNTKIPSSKGLQEAEQTGTCGTTVEKEGKNKWCNYDFTEDEIEAAKKVVEKYFKATNENDLESYNQCVVDTKKVGENKDIYSGVTRELKTLEVNTDIYQRENISMYNTDSKVKYPIANVIVMDVNFEVIYDNMDLAIYYTMPEGLVEDYLIILVRESKDSPWLINSWGY